MIDFTLLGTAATMPLPDRALSSAVLRCAGRSILFDCGEGTQTAARKAHVSLMKTDLIALTHYHGDHIFGLPGLMQSMNCLGRTEPLYITGPENAAEELAPILQLAGMLEYKVQIVSGEVLIRDLNPLWPDGAVLTPFPTEHRIQSQGYAFHLPRNAKFLPEKAIELAVPTKHWGEIQKSAPEREFTLGGTVITAGMLMGEPRKGLRIVFSGDTAPCESLAAAAREADLFVCDATYGDDEQLPMAQLYGHCTFSQAGRLAAEAEVKRLWLTHYSQTVSKPSDCLENALRFFEAAECGFDGKAIKLTFIE